MREYLIDFEGYGSTLLFYKQNQKLCNNNRINDENELFVIMKRIFAKEFKDSIEFIRNPTLEKKGLIGKYILKIFCLIWICHVQLMTI